jgi:hypothetical protein
VQVVQTIVNAVVVGAVGILLARMTDHLRREVNGEIAEFRAGMRDEFAQTRQEIRDLRVELGEVRSDLTRVALAVDPGRRTGSG